MGSFHRHGALKLLLISRGLLDASSAVRAVDRIRDELYSSSGRSMKEADEQGHGAWRPCTYIYRLQSGGLVMIVKPIS